MKTLHRKMFEELPYEEFKEFCRVSIDTKDFSLDTDCTDYFPTELLCISMTWAYSPQGHSYWEDIRNRLDNEGN